MMEIRRLIPLESGAYDPNYEPALKRDSPNETRSRRIHETSLAKVFAKQCYFIKVNNIIGKFSIQPK